MAPSTPAPPRTAASPGTALRDPSDLRRRVLLALVATGLAAVPFTILLLAVATRSDWLARLDSIGTDQVHVVVYGQPWLWDLLRVISTVTEPRYLHSVALVVAITLWVRGRRNGAVWLVVTIASGWLLSAVVKELVQRARPEIADALMAGGYSFPSGHALNSMLFAACMVVLFNPYLPGRRRVGQWAVAGAFVLLVGLDRIALGVHYISDVLAAWVIALAVVAASMAAFGLSLTTPGADLADQDDAAPDDTPASGPAGDAVPARPIRSARQQGPTAPPGLGSQIAAIAVRLVPGWVGIWAVLVGLGLLVTRAMDGVWPMTAEDRVNTTFEASRTAAGNAVSFVMSELGSTLTIVAICVVMVAVLRRRLGRWRESLFVALCTLGQSLVFYFTTLAIDRERPDVDKLDESPPTSSFPSGHTSASIALYVSLAIVVHRTVERVWLRRLLVIALVSAPVMVGLARLYRGMHHPSDLVGALVNAGLVILVTDQTLKAVLGPDRRRW